MRDIVYPETPAPVYRGAKDHKCSEMLPLVNENGVVIRQASRPVCHTGCKYMHPVVHLHIMDRMGNIYLQRRSMTKKLLPGYWDTAVGGHISYGEHVSEALYREAGEELGFYDFNPQHLKTYVFESGIEKELVFAFAAIGHFALTPDDDEVSEGKWWTPEEIAAAVGKDVLTPNFESEYAMVKDALYALL